MAYKLAIIGLGKIAQDQHLPVVAKNSDFELAAVVSSRGVQADVPAFRTAAELFRSGVKLDAVGKIDIRDNVFVGYGAIILRGVTIGPNAIVAAGAVVT